MAWPLDSRLDREINRDVIAWLKRVQPSAHSDIASVLTDVIRGLPGAYHYCPDVHAYAFVAACTPEHGIFALAYGMSALALRLGPGDRTIALAEGGCEPSEIGDDWLEITGDGAVDLRRWCRAAFTYVSRLTDGPAPPARQRQRR